MAGYTLARELRKLDQQVPVVIISQDKAYSYAKPTLSNALAANKLPEQIPLADATKMAEQLHLDIRNHCIVESIDPARHQLTLRHNDQTTSLEYRQLVLAVGAQPIRLPLTGNAADEVMVVNHLDEYTAFRERLGQGIERRVLIIGAGLIGCEFANDLKSQGHVVTVIDLAAHALGRLLPLDVAQEYQQRLASAGITFINGVSVQTVEHGADGYRVQLSDGQVLPADVVLSAVGLRANTALAQTTGLSVNRGIVTDLTLATSQPDIYALGDCAEVNGLLLPYVMPLMQQARALAKTLTGETTTVHYPAMPVAVKTPAAPLTFLNAPDGVAVKWQIEPTEDGLLAQALDPQGQLRGFVLLGASAGKQRMALTKQVPDLLASAP